MFTSRKNRTIPLLGCIMAAVLLILSACSPLNKKAPPIANIYTEKSDLCFHLDFAKLEIPDDAIDNKFKQILPKLEKIANPEAIEILSNLDIDTSEFVELGGYLNGDLSCKQQSEAENNIENWLIAANFSTILPAKLLIQKINSSEDLKLIAKAGDKSNGFQLIEILNKDNQHLFNLALFTGKISQIRIGDDASLVHSMETKNRTEVLRKDMIHPENQFWIHANIPENFIEQAKLLESKLPFEPGSLASGFKSVTLSSVYGEMGLDNYFSMEFETPQQANTAFSYLQLGLTFAIKPYARKATNGNAKKFIRSIKNQNTGDLIILSFRITEDEVEAISKLFGKNANEDTVQFLLDLIKPTT